MVFGHNCDSVLLSKAEFEFYLFSSLVIDDGETKLNYELDEEFAPRFFGEILRTCI